MAIKEIPIAEKDVDYFNKITNNMKALEERIAALEVAKMNIFEEYKRLQDMYNSFSEQLKEKYQIPVSDASIDVDKKIISYDDEKIN